MSRKNGHFIHVPAREPARPQYEQPQCTIKPECAGCPYPQHGFICWSADGSCLRIGVQSARKEGTRHDRIHTAIQSL